MLRCLVFTNDGDQVISGLNRPVSELFNGTVVNGVGNYNHGRGVVAGCLNGIKVNGCLLYTSRCV